MSPQSARWDTELKEYLLDWDDVRVAADPRSTALEFGLSVIRPHVHGLRLGSGGAAASRDRRHAAPALSDFAQRLQRSGSNTLVGCAARCR